MFLESSRDKNTKDYAKLIRNLRKIIENHPYGVPRNSHNWN
jgi:hypothetical protein